MHGDFQINSLENEDIYQLLHLDLIQSVVIIIIKSRAGDARLVSFNHLIVYMGVPAATTQKIFFFFWFSSSFSLRKRSKCRQRVERSKSFKNDLVFQNGLGKFPENNLRKEGSVSSKNLQKNARR